MSMDEQLRKMEDGIRFIFSDDKERMDSEICILHAINNNSTKHDSREMRNNWRDWLNAFFYSMFFLGLVALLCLCVYKL